MSSIKERELDSNGNLIEKMNNKKSTHNAITYIEENYFKNQKGVSVC